MKVDKIPNKLENASLEEALDITSIGRFTVVMLIFCGSLMLGTILETLGFGYVLPGAQCALHIPPHLYTWVAAVPFSGYILTSHVWGWAADKWGRRRALMVSMMVGSSLSMISSLSPNLETFVTLRVAASLFIAGGAALGYAFLGEMCPRSNRDTIITLGNATVAAGTGVVPLLAWAVLPLGFSVPFWFLDYQPWRLLMALFAAPYMICSVACILLPESPKFLSSVGKDKEALEVLAMMYEKNTGKGKDTFPVASLKSEMMEGAVPSSGLATLWEQSVGIFRPPLLKYTIILSYMQFVVFGTSNGFYIWLPDVVTKVLSAVDTPYVNSSETSSTDFCSLLSTISTDASTSSEIFCNNTLRSESFTVAIYVSVIVTSLTVMSAFTAKYLGKRNLTVVLVSVVAASCIAMLLLKDPGVAVVAFSGLQLGGSIIGFINAFSVQIYPTNIRAMGVCMTMMVGRIGSLFATKTIGVLLASSCSSVFIGTLVLLALMLVAAMFLPKDDLQSCRPDKKNGDISI